MDIFQTTLSENPILKHLPEAIIHDPFWNQSHIDRPSTFGATPKPNTIKVDDPYTIKNDHNKWVHFDRDCMNHGRLTVESMWGRYKTAPPPGAYDPDHEKLSKRESFPKHKISSKARDHYFEKVEFARKNPLSPIGNVDPFNPFNIKKSEKKDIKISELSKINMDDMRKCMSKCTILSFLTRPISLMSFIFLSIALLPGPGQYKAKYEYGEKFDRPPVAHLKPRKPRTQPRQILDFTTMEIIEDRNKKCNSKFSSQSA